MGKLFETLAPVTFAYAPILVLAAMGLLILVLSAFVPREGRFFSWFALATCGMSLWKVIEVWRRSGRDYGPMEEWDWRLGLGFAVDHTYLVTMAILAVGGMMVCLLAGKYLERKNYFSAEFYGLLLISLAGMGFMASAQSLLALFVGLETMSICLYILAGTLRNHENSLEASLKYLMLGAFSTGFMVLGGALLYGSTGSLSYRDIGFQVLSAYIGHGEGFALGAPLFWTGFVFFIVGLAFKMALVPFHFWAPDVYQGSPTPVSALMATCAKAAVVVAALRFVLHVVLASPDAGKHWADAMMLLALVTLVVANLVALSQTHVKRLLAYSSVSHAGYLALVLGGLGHATDDLVVQRGINAILFYLAAYLLMTVGMFGLACVVERDENTDEPLQSWNGLAFRRPWMALAACVFLLSLAGIPPTAGFFGKFYLFRVLIEAGLIKWAVAAILMAVVGAFYYLRVVVAITMRPASEGVEPGRSVTAAIVVTVATLATLAIGFSPDLLLRFLVPAGN